MNKNKKTIRYYFSFNDPYSFLITPAVKSLAHDFKIDIEYIPLPGYDNAKIFSDDEDIRRYYRSDISRYAEKAGRKLIFDDKVVDSMAAVRGKWFADQHMLGFKYLNLVFAMRWVSSKDISDIKELISGLSFLEMNEADLTEAMTTKLYDSAVAPSLVLAKNDGVIGVPFLSFEGEGFYGVDRFEYLRDKLESDTSLKIHHDANYSVIKADELAKLVNENEDLLVLDLRIPKEFGESHIPGSNCLPSKIVHRNLNKIDRNKKIVLVDDGGVMAGDTAFMMATEGFSNVSVLSGGYASWKWESESGLEKWRDKLL